MTTHIDPLIAAQVDDSFEDAVAEAVAHVEHDDVHTVNDVAVVESIEDAYRRLYPSLVRLAYLLVDTQELAEEAVQEAFTRAWPKWRRVQHADAYLRTSVINACRKVQRRRRVARRQPESRVEHHELGADHVADVVRRLPSPMREAIVLRYYLQLSEAQIATTLGLAPGTVKSTLHRARSALKKELS